jgi:PTH1 family peptidyl-tRNA hydrolase
MPKNEKRAVVIGLGNPGKEYGHTYHNAGWLAVDAWMDVTIKNMAPSGEIPCFKTYKKLFEFAETDKIIFVKPLTYMNQSGKAIREALKKFGAKPENLIVIHDDSDLIMGTYKISFARNSAGHKGVQSIIDALKTNEFQRIRIGIRPAKEKRRQKAGEFALKNISPADRKILAQLFIGIIERQLERI